MVELASAGQEELMRLSFAGDVLNSLWYAKKSFSEIGAGWQPGFMSAVGTDPMSNQMLDFLGDAKIDTTYVRRIVDHRPGLYMIHLDGAERSFSYWRDSSAAKLLAADEGFLNNAVDAADALYFSGITLAILSDGDRAAMLGALSKAKSAGKMVAFDPNIRPALWADADAMRDAIMQAASCSTLVLPSYDDEATHFGDASLEATAARYRNQGCQTVIVKNGEGDMYILHADQDFVLDTPTVALPLDTTGAGDSFNGAFLASYLTTGDVKLAARAGQACAAKVICHYGALMPLEA